MALALYSDLYWYPDGTPAASQSVQIFEADNNTLAALYADAAGTMPLPNPRTTDGSGFLTFYASVGQYWVHIDSESFLIDVGLSQEQADLSTGLASGGDLNPDPGNPQAVMISPFVGYIVDNTDPLSVAPSITRVDYPGASVPLDAPALSRTITYWLVDAAQNVLQQAAYPTPDQFRTHLVIGGTVYDTGLGQVLEAQTLPTVLPQQANQLVDLMDAMGPFSINGNDISPMPGLMFSKTAGQVFARAFNYVSGITYTDNPHLTLSPASAPTTFRRILQNATVPTPPPVTTIDPSHYDVGGVITPVPGGPDVSTVQRVYLFAANTTSLRVAVQYGQVVYPTLLDAYASVGGGTEFIPAPVTRLGALIGYIVTTRTAVDLSDPAQATFVHAGKFATP